MKKVRELHDRAMSALERSFLAEQQGRNDRAAALLQKAFACESEAATTALRHDAPEPTKSVLLRSAATLALRCGHFRQAEKLVAAALAGDPPDEVVEELRDVLEQTHFSRHLELHGVALGEDELQLSLCGKEVAPGIVPSDELARRIDTMQKLVYRTAEHQEGRPYRETAGPSSDVRRNYRVFVSHARAASFAVTLRIARSKDQLELDPHPARELVDELLGRIESVNALNQEDLCRRIPDEAYFRNFVALAKDLAPSSDSIRQVGLTVLRNGRERCVAFTRRRTEICLASSTDTGVSDQKVESVEGTLLAADFTRGKRNMIAVVTAKGARVVVHVPPGMMADIVRPLWGQIVVVEGVSSGKNTVDLRDVRPADGDGHPKAGGSESG